MRREEIVEDGEQAGRAVTKIERELDSALATEPQPVATTDLVALAIDRDLDIEKLRALIDMRNAQEEREAKRAFDAAFSAMRSEFMPIERTKRGDKAKYASIDDMQKQYDPTIFAHGFYYEWDEEIQPDGGIRIIMTISGHGHQKSNSKYLPPYEPDKSSGGKSIMNSQQAEGARSSYGRRYTFIAGFGITVRDEDTDGRPMSVGEVEKITPMLATIANADTLDELKEAFVTAYNSTTDKTTRKLFADAKDRRKGELS